MQAINNAVNVKLKRGQRIWVAYLNINAKAGKPKAIVRERLVITDEPNYWGRGERMIIAGRDLADPSVSLSHPPEKVYLDRASAEQAVKLRLAEQVAEILAIVPEIQTLP